MATVRTISRRHGTAYRAEVCVEGRRAGKTFDRKSDAVRWGEDTENLLRSGGQLGAVPDGDIEATTAINRYEDEVIETKRPNTQARERTCAEHLRKFFGGKLLTEIGAPLVAQYRDLRLRKVGPATVGRELDVLSHLFEVARLEWGVKVENPVKIIRRPARPEGRLRLLTRQEARMLLDVCCEAENKNLYYYVLLMLHTGMRPSEAAGITWGQIDFEARMVELPVTKTTRRRVPVTREAMDALASIKPTSAGHSQRLLLPDNISVDIQRRPNLFFRRSFGTALKICGITDFTMHDLRHTAASHLLMSGVDLRTLAEILGHRTMEMVQRYTHLLDDHKRAAIDRLGGLGIS